MVPYDQAHSGGHKVNLRHHAVMSSVGKEKVFFFLFSLCLLAFTLGYF